SSLFSTGIAEIVLTSGELDISDSLTITGPTNATLIITGNDLGRVFDITTPGQSVQLSNLLITGGVATEGGGIINDGSALTLKNDILESNAAVATTPGANAQGGAVAITGSGASLTISGTSAVLSNIATGAPGAASGGIAGGGYGGALFIDSGTSATI